MKILSCGAGMQSSALHLMSCENALAKIRGEPPVWPQVPIYDISIFCDLGFEPPWVKKQVEFLANAGHSCGVPLVILDSPLYTDFMENFGERRTISIPWWTIRDDGHKSKMPRNCTIDYKVELISKYVRWELLGYKKGQRLREEDKKAQEKAEKLFKKALNNDKLKVRVESLKDESISAMIELSEQSRRMQDMMKMYGSMGMMGMPGGEDEILVLNKKNRLVAHLLESKKDDTAVLLANQLYDLARLSHRPLEAEELNGFIARSQELMSQLVDKDDSSK